jgi:hypothetical protein
VLTEREKLYVGTWRHSHEEDTPTTRVFRRKEFAFPRSRGRVGWELRPDHTGTYLAIAARDGTAAKDCTWQAPGDGNEIVLKLPDGTEQKLSVVAVESDRLEIRK